MCASPVHRLLVVTIAGSAKTLGSIRIFYLNVRSRELLSFPARTTFWRGTPVLSGAGLSEGGLAERSQFSLEFHFPYWWAALPIDGPAVARSCEFMIGRKETFAL